MADTRSQTVDFVGRQPKITLTDEIRWSKAKQCLLRKAWQSHQLIWLPFESPPDLTGLRVSRDKRTPKLYLGVIADTARQASAVPEQKRTTEQRMAVAAWNITWHCIKRRRPALAEFLQSDFVRAMRDTFNATIQIDLETL